MTQSLEAAENTKYLGVLGLLGFLDSLHVHKDNSAAQDGKVVVQNDVL